MDLLPGSPVSKPFIQMSFLFWKKKKAITQNSHRGRFNLCQSGEEPNYYCFFADDLLFFGREKNT